MGISIDKNAKKQLKDLVLNSTLKDIEKKYWGAFIRITTEKDASLILETIQEDSTVLSFLTKNLETKLKTLNSKNKDGWKNIVKEEKKFIESK